MTRAPDSLLAVRTLLLDHLRPHGLKPDAVGVIGDPAHVGGYHCGSDRLYKVGGVVKDYSVVESSRDRAGLTLDAAALDVGEFAVKSGGKTYDLDHFNAWLIRECKANAADTRDIREVIYRTDATTVKRWDRLGRRSTGDGSHRWHTHISFFRDAIKAGRDETALFRRYLQSIGLLKAATPGEDDMALSAEDKALLAALHADVRKILTGNLSTTAAGGPENALLYWIRTVADAQDPAVRKAYPAWTPTHPGLTQIAAQLDKLSKQFTPAEIVAGVLAGLGTRPAADVAQALVAAGQDPARLAAALTALTKG